VETDRSYDALRIRRETLARQFTRDHPNHQTVELLDMVVRNVRFGVRVADAGIV
jgi:hypothetical protein